MMLRSALIYAQSPTVQWDHVYNGTCGYEVEQTSDSGYIIVGEIWRGPGLQDLHLIKTNSSGDTIWTKCYEGANINSIGYSVHQAFDGGFVAVGSYADQLYIVKTNPAGNLLWSRTFVGASQTWGNAGFSVTQAADSGFAVAGFTSLWGLGDNVFLIKLTNDGDTSWVQHYGDNHWERGYSVIPTSDSGLIIAGSSRPANTLDYWDNPWFMKTDSDGNTEWIKTYNWPNVDVARSIQMTPDGGYLAAGYTNSFGAGDYDYFLMKLNSDGDSLWCKIYGNNYAQICYSLKSLSDGNYILAGTEYTLPYNVPRILLVKINPSGDTLWTKAISNTSNNPFGYSIDETFDNGYIVTGKLESTYLVKLLNVNTFPLSVSVSNGWNMVSVPGINPDGQGVNNWWANHIGNVYKFVPGSGYSPVVNTIPGEGYWMKNNGVQTYNTGDEWPAEGIQPVAHDPINAVPGWNMFGGYEDVIDAAALTTTPPGQIISVYKYVPGAGYEPAAEIVPGFGYWVKVSSACQINFPDLPLAEGNTMP